MLFALQLICVAEVPFLSGNSQTICFVFNLTNSGITNKISAETVSTAKRGGVSIAAASLIGNSGKVMARTLELAILIRRCTFSVIREFQGYARSKSQHGC